MKTLLIDDERLPRAELRRMLAAFPQLEIVGEAADATEARALIDQLGPELLFLDVQMPEESGLDLLASLRRPLQVIFVTAHDQHAVQAFEFGAVDYLLKPVEPRRLEQAVSRLTQKAETEEEVQAESDPPALLSGDQKVLVRDGSRSWFIPVSAIHGAEACGAYAKLWLADGAPLVHRSLSFLERRLPAALFFRASRSEIVNLQSVQKVETWFSGGLRLTLPGGRAIEVSRRQAKLFRERVSL